jgi:hypothetical protein
LAENTAQGRCLERCVLKYETRIPEWPFPQLDRAALAGRVPEPTGDQGEDVSHLVLDSPLLHVRSMIAGDGT